MAEPRELAQMAQAALARSAAQQERKGERVVHPDQNPNAQRWVDSIAKDETVVPFPQRSPGNIVQVREAIPQFLNSPQFKHWLSTGNKGNSGFLQIEGGILGPVAKAVQLGTVADMREVLATSYVPGIVPQGSRWFRIRDMVTVLPTSQGSIQYLRETGFTNNAGVLAEQTDPASITASGASTLTVSLETASVKAISHHINFPRTMLDDMPLLNAYLDSRMSSGIDDEEDTQLLHGDNDGNNITGFFNDTGVTEYAWGASGVSGDNRADAFLMAAAQIANSNYMPTGIGMGITDWARICKLKDADGNYLLPQAHMRSTEPATLWGLPVALSQAFTLGQGIVGAFANPGACYVADRQQTRMFVTDSHASNFTGQVLTMLWEKRLALVISRPEAFRQVSLNTSPSGSES